MKKKEVPCKFCGKSHYNKAASLYDRLICKRGASIRLIAYAPLFDDIDPIVIKKTKEFEKKYIKE